MILIAVGIRKSNYEKKDTIKQLVDQKCQANGVRS